MITSEQIRAARALLRMDQRHLAELSGLSLPTVQRLEAGEGMLRCHLATLARLTDALTGEGVAFLPDEGERGGDVRLRQGRA